MRKILLIILACCSGMLVSFYDPDDIESPDPVTDSCEIRLYRYYVTCYYKEVGRMSYLNNYYVVSPYSSTISGYSSDTIGMWRSSGDTMLIYEDYYDPGVSDTLDVDALDPDGWIYWGPDFRCQIPSNFTYLDSSYTFAANVSAFGLRNYGDEIYGRCKYCGIPQKYVPLSIYKYHYWDIFKHWIWQFVRFGWRDGEYRVRNKVVVGGRTLIVDIEKEGVVFQIVNPVCYLKSDSVRYYRKEQEAELSGWLDTVRVGRLYRFSLQRPAYPADSLAKVKYLRTLADSLYISKPIEIDKLTAEQLEEIRTTVNPDTCREAYGYFFAKLIKI